MMNLKKLWTNPCKPKKGRMYAVLYGTYGGDYIVVLSATKNSVTCVTLPYFNDLVISMKDFKNGVKEHVVEFVEELPAQVFEDVLTQRRLKRKENETNNRR